MDAAHTTAGIDAVAAGVSVLGAVPPTGDSAPFAHNLARRAVGAVAGVDPGAVTLVSLCRHCGLAHGALRVTGPRTPRAFASVSRAPGFEVAAATLRGAIGIDIEAEARMARAQVDGVALHPREMEELAGIPEAGRNTARTVQWTRKEALLKATGFGLRIAPSELLLGGIGRNTAAGPIRVLAAPEELLRELRVLAGPPLFQDMHGDASGLALPDGIVGTICLLPG